MNQGFSRFPIKKSFPMGAYASGLDRHSYKVKAGGSNPPVPTDLPSTRMLKGVKGSSKGDSGNKSSSQEVRVTSKN